MWRDISGDRQDMTSTNDSSSETRLPVAVETNRSKYEILIKKRKKGNRSNKMDEVIISGNTVIKIRNYKCYTDL